MNVASIKKYILAVGLLAMLQVSTPHAWAESSKIDVPCTQGIIDARDTALAGMVNDWASSAARALEARRDALKESWTIIDYKGRRTAQRKAWRDYDKALRGANAEKAKERNQIWKTFEHERRKCEGAYSPEMITGSKHDASL